MYEIAIQLKRPARQRGGRRRFLGEKLILGRARHKIEGGQLATDGVSDLFVAAKGRIASEVQVPGMALADMEHRWLDGSSLD